MRNSTGTFGSRVWSTVWHHMAWEGLRGLFEVHALAAFDYKIGW